PILVYDAGGHDCDTPANRLPPYWPPVIVDPGPAGPGGPGGPPGGPPPGGGPCPNCPPIIIRPPDYIQKTPDVFPVEVGVRLTQSGVMVRRAFSAFFELFNGSPNILSNLSVTLDIRDTNGMPAPNFFGIKPPHLTTNMNGSGVLPT